MSAKTAWETVKNSVCYFSLFLYVHLKAVFFLIWNTALQEKWKSIYMYYFRSSYTEMLSKVAHSNFDSLHFFIFFFHPWLTNRPVKLFSLSYANLFFNYFVINYWKVVIVLKLSYFTKIFGRCPQPIIIDDVLFTSMAYYLLSTTLIRSRKLFILKHHRLV